MNKNILTKNPFQSIDENGVGNLIKLVIQNCKKNKQKMEIGICGEHGGDPESIKFFQNAQINYVSASPHRIPIAIISSAQTTIINKTKHTK